MLIQTLHVKPTEILYKFIFTLKRVKRPNPFMIKIGWREGDLVNFQEKWLHGYVLKWLARGNFNIEKDVDSIEFCRFIKDKGDRDTVYPTSCHIMRENSIQVEILL